MNQKHCLSFNIIKGLYKMLLKHWVVLLIIQFFCVELERTEDETCLASHLYQ